MNLPNRMINIKELEQARREAAQALGVRYYRLTPRQAIEALVAHNSQFSRFLAARGNPFPSTQVENA